MSLDAALEEVLAELAATNAELSSLPRDAFEQRAILHSRLNELRGVAAELRTQPPTDRAALRDRLTRLETELQHRLRYRVSSSAAAQTGMGGGIDPEFVHALNRQIDQGQGVAQLKAEIDRIKALLANE
jgi:hypothetical protein